MSSYTALTLQLCLNLVQLKQNSYWLVKVQYSVCEKQKKIRANKLLRVFSKRYGTAFNKSQ